MKQKFNLYLQGIGLTSTIIDRVTEIHNFYTNFLKQEIEEIFVSEYINPDGSRIYENLWFFNKTHCFEAKQFILNDDFDIDYYSNQIISFNTTKRDFNSIDLSYNENSRMNLTFYFNANRVGNLKASKINCKSLAEISLNYILLNLKK